MAGVRARIVEVLVVRFREKHIEYLLLKRSSLRVLYPGIWQIVSGKIRRGEKATLAARREVREETRLKIDRMWTAPFIIQFYNPAADVVEFGPLFVATAASRARPVLSREHESFRWLPWKKARRLLFWPDDRKALALVHHILSSRSPIPTVTSLR